MGGPEHSQMHTFYLGGAEHAQTLFFFFFLAHSAMKLLKILCLFLLGSDFQLKSASLEAKIPPAPKCDGRWKFTPQSPWVLAVIILLDSSCSCLRTEVDPYISLVYSLDVQVC